MNLPGTPYHQQILNSILDYYKGDTRVLAIIVFGSLERGDWDKYSDIDLDITLTDDSEIDARAELFNLVTTIKQIHNLDAIIIVDDEEGDVVLSNLLEFSIRYHRLDDTKPAILDSMQLLAGKITLEDIHINVNENYISKPIYPVDIVNQCLRYILELHNAIMRNRLWMCLDFLTRIRGLLIDIYGITHNRSAIRSTQFFDANANMELNKLLSKIVPQTNINSIRESFNHLLQLEQYLNAFSKETYELTQAQKSILSKLNSL